jgi:hypothetical protein
MGSHELGQARDDQAGTPTAPTAVNQFGIPIDTPGATQPTAFLSHDGPTRYVDTTPSFSRSTAARRSPVSVSGSNAIRMIVSGIALVLAVARLIHSGASAVSALDSTTGASAAFTQGQCVTVSVDTTRASTSTLARISDVPCSRSDAHVILRTGSMKGKAQDEASVAAAVRKAAPSLAAQGDVYWSATQWILVATATAAQQGVG